MGSSQHKTVKCSWQWVPELTRDIIVNKPLQTQPSMHQKCFSAAFLLALIRRRALLQLVIMSPLTVNNKSLEASDWLLATMTNFLITDNLCLVLYWTHYTTVFLRDTALQSVHKQATHPFPLPSLPRLSIRIALACLRFHNSSFFPSYVHPLPNHSVSPSRHLTPTAHVNRQLLPLTPRSLT